MPPYPRSPAIQRTRPATYATLRPHLCALPSTDLSPINVNTLTEAQAPLLVMLSGGFERLADHESFERVNHACFSSLGLEIDCRSADPSEHRRGVFCGRWAVGFAETNKLNGG